jgi:hypothetical protein
LTSQQTPQSPKIAPLPVRLAMAIAYGASAFVLVTGLFGIIGNALQGLAIPKWNVLFIGLALGFILWFHKQSGWWPYRVYPKSSGEQPTIAEEPPPTDEDETDS